MLTLPIKKKWFDMIKSGEKKEEYREIKPYWTQRFYNNFYNTGVEVKTLTLIQGAGTVIFKNGYGKNAPQIKCTIELRKDYGKEEWGAEKGKMYYVLKILSVEKVGDDNE